MSEQLRGKLEKARLELLDLSARNRLLNAPLEKAAKSARAIRVRDEIASEVYRLLVEDGKALSFASGVGAAEAAEAAAEDTSGEAGLPQPDENEAVDERGVKARHRDSKLQTSLTSAGLQKRLLQMYYDARTFQEEQGVNILYLALGFLQWVEADTKAVRYAPLVLVPVTLERQSAAERFRLRWTGEDPDGNLTLAAKMTADFQLRMPAFPDPNSETFDLPRYFDSVAEAVSGQSGWAVRRDDILLGFFSFAKFLMYRDLDPANWPDASLDRHPLVAGLMGSGIGAQPLSISEDDTQLDEHLRVPDLAHVVDADSSQTLAIHEARRGANLVIQGPPGTGKSQTISNIIAAAVLDGRKVLFLAEKMAALEVVKRRLDAIGLGPICLEMHSNKVQKRAVLDELARTLQAGRPAALQDTGLPQALEAARTQLNRHCDRMHRKHAPGEVSAYESMGVLIRLRNRGLEPVEVSLEAPESWTPAERIRRKNLIGQLADWIAANGLPDRHAWHGAQCPPMLRADAEVLLAGAGVAVPLVEAAGLAALRTFGLRQLDPAWRIAKHLRANPGLPKAPGDVRVEAWTARAAEIRQLVARGAAWARMRAEADAVFVPAAWDQDVRQVRHNLAVHGDGAFKFLFGSFREAKNLLASLLRNPGAMPGSSAERVALVDRLLAGQAARAEFAQLEPLGRDAFGSLWRGADSDFALLARVAEWASANPAALQWLSCDPEPAFASLDGCRTALLGLAQRLAMDPAVLCEADLGAVHERVRGWLADPEGLSRWTTYYAIASEARSLGLGGMVDLLAGGGIPAAQALDRFAFAYHTAMLRAMASRDPELARFDGDTHSRQVDHFASLDSQLLARNRAEVMRRHDAGIPRVSGPVGALGVVASEIAKKRRHLPLRQLVKQAGPALQALKPVFLMSPLSVAQFLEPGAIEFDLLVVDEASQIQPVDALGAISRCRQAVVVGDDRQLPPTQFFSRLMGGDEEAELAPDEESGGAGDLESILGLCRAKGFPERMLRWHYRSRHESLIAVSNHEFYDNRLYIIPSALRSEGGLRFHHMPQAVYEPGAGVNRAEAKVVAAAVLRHAIATPSLSLGVGTFSIRQRDAILEELEVLRRAHPETESFFSGGGAHEAEPFFVKNLENVQGDERDVIFISVGYGRDASGTFAMRFGALNASGGERRLNVLISRAKLRCEVFSPILAEDIDPQRARGRGVAALRTFLQYAQRGELPGAPASTNAAAPQGGGRKLVEEIAACVTAAGYQVSQRFGLAGLYVELAVFSPSRPDRVLMGIEIDGDEYRAARCARDRDRLRASVLERQGWRLHRVWAADWYQRPAEQTQRLLAALEAANRDLPRESTPAAVAEPLVAAIPQREDPAASPAEPLTQPYEEARIAAPANLEPHEVPVWKMVEIVREIVRVEGPVHEEEVIARVRQAFGLARAGSRVQQAVRNAISQAGLESPEPGFYQAAGATTVQARDRSGVESAGLRKPELIAAAEYDAAILAVVRAHLSASRDQALVLAARALGFRATSGVLRAALDARIDALLASGALLDKTGMLVIP